MAELYFLQPGGQVLPFISFSHPFLHFWNELEKIWREVLAFTYRARATPCTATRAPWSPENGARSLLSSKFRQLKLPSVKPNHAVPLVEGGRFSVGNSEQSYGCWMHFEGAFPLSKERMDYSPCPWDVCTTTVLPELYYLPSCSALVGTTEQNIKRHERGERKLDQVAAF